MYVCLFRQRLSTTSADPGYQVYGHYRPDYVEYGRTEYGREEYGRPDYGLELGSRPDYGVDGALNKSSQRLVNSDLSSSTLGRSSSLTILMLHCGSYIMSDRRRSVVTQNVLSNSAAVV